MKITLAVVALAVLIPSIATAQEGRLNLSFLDRLAERASEKQVIDIPAEMLRGGAGIVSGLVPGGPGGDAAKQLLSELQGVFVRSFEFDDPKAYSMDDIAAIRKQLAAPGWLKIISNEEKDKRGDWELQEIYLFQRDGKTNGIVILNSEPGELQIVNIVGPIDLARLGILGGVLGIPRVPGVPRPPQPPQPPQPPR